MILVLYPLATETSSTASSLGTGFCDQSGGFRICLTATFPSRRFIESRHAALSPSSIATTPRWTTVVHHGFSRTTLPSRVLVKSPSDRTYSTANGSRNPLPRGYCVGVTVSQPQACGGLSPSAVNDPGLSRRISVPIAACGCGSSVPTRWMAHYAILLVSDST